jgi:hypothetical protein
MVKGLAVLAVLVACSAGLFAGLSVHDHSSDAADHARSRAFVRAAALLCSSTTEASLLRSGRLLLQLPDASRHHRGLVRLAIDWRLLAQQKPGSKAYAQKRKEARLAAHLLNVKACELVPRE